MATLKCRPTESEKDPIMVFMSATQLLALKLRNGDICTISHKDQTISVVAWHTSKADLKEGVVGVSKWLQDQCGIKLGNEVGVEKSAREKVLDAATVTVRCLDEIEAEKRLVWELNAVVAINEGQRYVALGQVVEVGVGRLRRRFEVVGTRGAIFKAASISRVRIGEAQENEGGKITFGSIGGLQAQKARLRQCIRKMMAGTRRVRHSLDSHAMGVLLYGPGGTGKSSLRRAIEAEHDWSTIVFWEGAGSKLPQHTASSMLVHIDMTSKLGPADAKVLKQLFRALPSTTMIVGEIRDPNDLLSILRTSSTFAHEIEVSIPDAEQRLEILRLLNHGLLSENLLQEAAQKTHGYVGDDLSRLLEEIEDLLDQESSTSTEQAVTNGTTKQHEEPINSAEQSLATLTHGTEDPQQPETQPTSTSTSTSPTPIVTQPIPSSHPTTPTLLHLSSALTHIRPSALQQVFLEKPSIHWHDIGGQTALKHRLRTAVDWPILYPSELKSYSIPPKKGILLYGPPGCSKTMLVKALATESSYNFLAVKGAELISMYVGESERATRDVFRKARSASPCIIFFDEIDSIAKRSGGAGNGGSGGSELNVLTTLLNEMDGFEELRGVLVVAATNKPQVIDPALMRPGRFDNVVYIGPPDEGTRAAIFEERARKTHKFGGEAKESAWIDEYVRVSEGMSGAEIVAACQLAGEIAFSSGPELREITPDDVLEALRRTPRAITKHMLDEYETWNAERVAS